MNPLWDFYGRPYYRIQTNTFIKASIGDYPLMDSIVWIWREYGLFVDIALYIYSTQSLCRSQYRTIILYFVVASFAPLFGPLQ
jgi:hypothetical protein